MNYANLPGHMPVANSWSQRASKGFHSASIGRTAQAEAERGKPQSLAAFAPEVVAEEVPEVNQARQRQVLWTEAAEIDGLLSGGGVFSPKADDKMKTNTMDLGAGLGAYKPTVAKFVEEEKIVCRFFGYFSQPRIWPDNNPIGQPTSETTVYRLVEVHYHMDSDCIAINETKQINSGNRAGTFYRKAPLNKADGTKVTLGDLQVGNAVNVLGQELKVCDADKATRDLFRRRLNIIMTPAMNMPKPPLISDAAALATGLTSHPPGEKSGGSASAGYVDRKKQLNKEYQYLYGDKRVLRFLAIRLGGNDDGMTMADVMLGPDIKYSLAYYLVDDTMDVKLIKERRGSTSDQTVMLKRAKFPVNWRETPDKHVMISPPDLSVGAMIECFGRQLRLLDCDEPTRAFYREIGIEQPSAVDTSKPVVAKPLDAMGGGGFLAIGSQNDDGLAKQTNKAKSAQKEESRGKALRVRVKQYKEGEPETASDEPPADVLRKFFMFYHLEDDTVNVFEDVAKNSGLPVGGNFLKRGKYQVSVNGGAVRPPSPQDLQLSNIISLCGTNWKVIEVDTPTRTLCTSMPSLFPSFDPRAVAQKLLAEGKDIKAGLERYDRDGTTCISVDLFKHAMDAEGLWRSLSAQERQTIVDYVSEPIAGSTSLGCFYMDLIDLMACVNASSQGSPTYEPERAGVLSSLLGTSHKMRWRKAFRTNNKAVGSCMPITSLLEVLATGGCEAPVQHDATIRYYFGLDPSTNAAAFQELKKKQPSSTPRADSTVARGAGAKAVRARSLKDISVPEKQAASVNEVVPDFVCFDNLCDDAFRM